MRQARELLMKGTSWIRGHKLRVILLSLVLTIAAPWPAEGQFSPCCAILAAGLSSISSALQSVIGGGLNQILGIDQSIQQFEQNFVWPQNLINQARSLVGNLQSIFNQIQTLTKIQVNSATLPNAQQLETNLLSRNANQIAQTSANYTALYGSVPAATDASQQVRDMVDMTDAAAQAAMKRAIEIDARQLHAVHTCLRSVRIHLVPGWAPRTGSLAQPSNGTTRAHLLCESNDLSKLGLAVRDPPGPDYRVADEQHQCGVGRKWCSQRVRRIQPDGPLGCSQRVVLHRHCADPVRGQPYGAWGCRQYSFCFGSCCKPGCQNRIQSEHVLTSLLVRSSPIHT